MLRFAAVFARIGGEDCSFESGPPNEFPRIRTAGPGNPSPLEPLRLPLDFVVRGDRIESCQINPNLLGGVSFFGPWPDPWPYRVCHR